MRVKDVIQRLSPIERKWYDDYLKYHDIMDWLHVHEKEMSAEDRTSYYTLFGTYVGQHEAYNATKKLLEEAWKKFEWLYKHYHKNEDEALPQDTEETH